MVHIVHNLDDEYQGRIYLDGEDLKSMVYWTEMPIDFTVDPFWAVKVINPSRCALLFSDQWTTVSKTYKREILKDSSLKTLLAAKPRSFAFPNGVDDSKIKKQLFGLQSHNLEKMKLLAEFFGLNVDEEKVEEYVLFGFVGRICSQKGVMLIFELVEKIIRLTNFKAFFVIGGMIDGSVYSKACSDSMSGLSEKFPNNFWGNPNVFFKKGVQLNRAADFFLMPSMFEPGGIVQHEALIAGTPVIVFRTGGLNDTINEFSFETEEGNGFLFNNFNAFDFQKSIEKALACFYKKEKYNKLRLNCEKSFMSIQRVAKSWRGEFYRLFNKV